MSLTPGVYLQIYRSALKGSNQAEKIGSLRSFLGSKSDASNRGLNSVCGVVLHGFPRELTKNFITWAKPIREAGWLTLASWGLDGATDDDGSRLTAAEKGSLVGQVLVDPYCRAGLLDAEGQWDSDTGADDDMDESGALALTAALRKVAPNALVGDQPWFAIDSHGSVRKKPQPIDKGSVFQGFPVDEFAACINWRRFRQAYCNNFTKQWGVNRYSKVFSWMEKDWKIVDDALRTQNLSRPLGVTIQGYGWVLHHLVDCILTEVVTKSQEVIVWCDALPDATTMNALFIVQRLDQEGFLQTGRPSKEIVSDYQRKYNQRSDKKTTLVVDGWAGTNTLSSMK
jgi:hypothetical protein